MNEKSEKHISEKHMSEFNASLVLGGSRGLGKSLCQVLSKNKEECLALSRSTDLKLDLTQSDAMNIFKSSVQENNFSHVFYVAGGGPHGPFFDKPLHSHKWAFELNYFKPVEIAHYLKSISFKGVFVFIGSAIAENRTSSKSLSYSLSKRASVKTLLSLSEEELKVRVFSPPYMNTSLLPLKAWPRLENPELVIEPNKVAEVLIEWLHDPLNASLSLSETFDPRHFDWSRSFTYTLPERKDY
jgi:short-subunit dehydrogenase